MSSAAAPAEIIPGIANAIPEKGENRSRSSRNPVRLAPESAHRLQDAPLSPTLRRRVCYLVRQIVWYFRPKPTPRGEFAVDAHAPDSLPEHDVTGTLRGQWSFYAWSDRLYHCAWRTRANERSRRRKERVRREPREYHRSQFAGRSVRRGQSFHPHAVTWLFVGQGFVFTIACG